MTKVPIKKMVTEVLLILPLYPTLFLIWWRFRHLIKTMADVGKILNDEDFFGDIVDTPKEGQACIQPLYLIHFGNLPEE